MTIIAQSLPCAGSSFVPEKTALVSAMAPPLPKTEIIADYQMKGHSNVNPSALALAAQGLNSQPSLESQNTCYVPASTLGFGLGIPANLSGGIAQRLVIPCRVVFHEETLI